MIVSEMTIPELAAEFFQCPRCGVPSRQACWSRNLQRPLDTPHDERLQLAQKNVQDARTPPQAPHKSRGRGPWIIRDPADHELIHSAWRPSEVRAAAETLQRTGHDAEILDPDGSRVPYDRKHWAEPPEKAWIVLQWRMPGDQWQDIMTCAAWMHDLRERSRDLAKFREHDPGRESEWRMVRRTEQELEE